MTSAPAASPAWNEATVFSGAEPLAPRWPTVIGPRRARSRRRRSIVRELDKAMQKP
jgi:hypothetical protein